MIDTKKIGPRHLFILLLLAYLPVAYFGARAYSYNNDEFFYYLMGREIAAGKIPYVDFFSGHMPLMLYSVALSFKLFGVSIASGKLVPLASSFALICLVYLTGEKIRANAGVVASILLFFSPLFQLYSHAFYGVVLAAALITAAAYFHLCGRKTLSGFFCVISVFTRLNAAPIAVGLVILNIRSKDFLKGIVFASPLFLFFMVPHFVEDTILYHLMKNPNGVEWKLSILRVFGIGQWLILGLSAVALVNWASLEKQVRELMMLSGLFYAFTVLSGTLFDFYLFVGLPLLAIVSADSILRYGQKPMVFAGVIFLFLAWSMFNMQSVFLSYTPREGIEPLIDKIAENAGGGRVFCMSLWCPYMLFKSGSGVAGDMLDSADARLEVYPHGMEIAAASALAGKNSLAVVDLKELNMYRAKFKANMSDVVDLLLDRYFPVYYMNSVYSSGGADNWVNSLNQLVFFKPKDEILTGKPLYPLNGSADMYFLEEYVTISANLSQIKSTSVTRVENMSFGSVYLPDYISGGNRFNMTLLENSAITWPLVPGASYVVSGRETYHIYVSPQSEGSINIFIITRRGSDILSFSQATYDLKGDGFSKLRVYSRLSERLLTGYAPTYVQTRIDRDTYDKIALNGRL